MPSNRISHLLHHVIARCNPNDLGAVKLVKILWFSDLEMYRRHRRTITGLTAYMRLAQGPVPVGFYPALEALKAEGLVSESRVAVGSYLKKQFASLVAPQSENIFSPEEIDIINTYADVVCKNFTASEISELTHDAYWHEVEPGGMMLIAAAAVIDEEVTPEDIAWGDQQFAENPLAA